MTQALRKAALASGIEGSGTWRVHESQSEAEEAGCQAESQGSGWRTSDLCCQQVPVTLPALPSDARERLTPPVPRVSPRSPILSRQTKGEAEERGQAEGLVSLGAGPGGAPGVSVGRGTWRVCHQGLPASLDGTLAQVASSHCRVNPRQATELRTN